MYDYLNGRITRLYEGTVVLDHSGIGFLIEVPLTVINSVRLDQDLTMYVHHHLSEHETHLYGFLDRFSRDVFLLLISVSGVGPKMGLRILGHKSARELVEAVAAKDLQTIKGVKGLGEKTSKKLIIEIQKKAENLVLSNSYASDLDEEVSDQNSNQVVKVREMLRQALVALGFKENEMKHLLDQVVQEELNLLRTGKTEALDFEIMLKKLLERISSIS